MRQALPRLTLLLLATGLLLVGGPAVALAQVPLPDTDWTVRSTFVGEEGEDIPLRIGRHDSPIRDGFGVRHIQDGHDEVPDEHDIGAVLLNSGSLCEDNPNDGKSRCALQTGDRRPGDLRGLHRARRHSRRATTGHHHRLLLPERMRLLSADDVDPEAYMDRAEDVALAGVSEGLAPHAGRLLGHERWTDENGHWLRVRVELASRPGVEVHYARVMLPLAGADMGADGEAVVFSSGFEERLHTRVHHLKAVDGVVTL